MSEGPAGSFSTSLATDIHVEATSRLTEALIEAENRMRRRIQMVFQDPYASLNPRRRAGELVAQGPMIHGMARDAAMAKARELFALVGLDPAAIERFPHEFSGGQRQRIAIARVMLKDAPILLLDEATSALDSEVESVIQRDLYRLMEGKTVIAIAHRLSTIAAMDRLIVMDQGRIVETGSHADLIAMNGLYARLWSHQSGGFLIDTDEAT